MDPPRVSVIGIGELVCEMLIEAVEKRFRSVDARRAGHELEFLSGNGNGNGSACIAHAMRNIVRSLVLTQ